MSDYAPDGVIGLLTPQANVTAEAEFRLLAAPGMGLATARLTSHAASMEARLLDYVERADETVSQFADAPLNALAFACTGSSYVVGPAREAAWTARIEAARKLPFVTAGAAVAQALKALRAVRIAAVSPYGAGLTSAALAYWRACGLEVVHVEPVRSTRGAAHPVYSLGTEAVCDAAARAELRPADALVLLGTGAPTLRALTEAAFGGPPRLSSTLALSWLATARVRGEPGDPAALQRLASGADWASRLPSPARSTLEPSP